MALAFAVKGHLFNIVLAISSAAMVTLVFFYTVTYFPGPLPRGSMSDPTTGL